MKPLLVFVGVLSVVLATLGVFLPLLPTTPFLLLAAACFSRASPRLHKALLSNRVFGPYLYDFQVHRGLTLQAKITALCVLWLSLAFSMYKVPAKWLQLLLLAIGLAVSAYIGLRLKTLKPGKYAKQQPDYSHTKPAPKPRR